MEWTWKVLGYDGSLRYNYTIFLLGTRAVEYAMIGRKMNNCSTTVTTAGMAKPPARTAPDELHHMVPRVSAD